MKPLLQVDDLNVTFQTHAGKIKAVRGVSFAIHEGETLGIVGESGSGKSVTAKALMKLLPSLQVKYERGAIWFRGANLLEMNEREMQAIRGKEISMIFQDPMTSFNPTKKVGSQIIEGMKKHEKIESKIARKRALRMLEFVGIPHPEERIDQYPHEYSGGMRQRAMIAMALACDPKLVIADEPTTALDVTIQAQILERMKVMQDKLGTAILFITHDLGVVAEMCDRVAVMYAGKIVEIGPVQQLFAHPQHPYTQGLLMSIPRVQTKKHNALIPIVGSPPDLYALPQGCAFYPRCRFAMRICKQLDPKLHEIRSSQFSACWLNHPLSKKQVLKEAKHVDR